MFFFLLNNCSVFSITIYQWFLLLFLLFKPTYSQKIVTVEFILSNPGTQFVPENMVAQLISIAQTDSVKKCIQLCMNNVLCRIYDYEVVIPGQCRLFEGDTNTLGQIVSSPSPHSTVGTLYLSQDLFAEYGSRCTFFCNHSRYLQCGSNFICECMPHTYWNASVAMCLPQSPILGASCQQNKNMCRVDINYTCLQFNQCGPLSVLFGTTIMDNNTVFGDNSTVGISYPLGIAVFGTDADSIVVVDENNNRVVGLWNIGTINQNTSVVTTEWAPGQPLCIPYDLYVDSRNGYNLYVSDYCHPQVILYANMQSVNPPPRYVAGTNHTGGPGFEFLNAPAGIQVDSHYNVIVVSSANNRIMFWPPNATNGTLIAGLTIPSNTSMGVDGPFGAALDERNLWLYVVDSNNHRVQRYSLNDTWPCNGTTVAGGNGPGSGANQLYYPTYIRLSKKTGAMYITDTNNHRIQRWKLGATEGVTIFGDPNGNPGNSATEFEYPQGLAINANETYMYVTDGNNNRVQQFQLI